MLKIHKKSRLSTENVHFLIDPSGCRLGQVALLQSFMATGWRSVEGVWPVVAATALLHRRAGQRGTISGAGGQREPYRKDLGRVFCIL